MVRFKTSQFSDGIFYVFTFSIVLSRIFHFLRFSHSSFLYKFLIRQSSGSLVVHIKITTINY